MRDLQKASRFGYSDAHYVAFDIAFEMVVGAIATSVLFAIGSLQRHIARIKAAELFALGSGNVSRTIPS
jgi:hypothetical protein